VQEAASFSAAVRNWELRSLIDRFRSQSHQSLGGEKLRKMLDKIEKIEAPKARRVGFRFQL